MKVERKLRREGWVVRLVVGRGEVRGLGQQVGEGHKVELRVMGERRRPGWRMVEREVGRSVVVVCQFGGEERR